jgi:thiamine-monophosphate kinase
VHFDRTLMSPQDIGRRAMAVNLSDLGAMGATPRAALVSLGLPEALPVADFEALLDGLHAVAAEHRTAVVGGNLTRTTGPLFIDVTAIGSVRPRRVLRRGGARAGDALYVSGRMGAAAAGLAWLRRRLRGDAGSEVESAVQRFRTPSPRVRLGQLVGRSRAASACMDLSDGLGDAVSQVASASGLGAEIDLDAVPMHGAIAALGLAPEDARRLALGSDDYELLFAVPRRRQRALLAAAALARVPVTRIGQLRKTQGIVATSADGSACAWPAGYSHFVA